MYQYYSNASGLLFIGSIVALALEGPKLNKSPDGPYYEPSESPYFLDTEMMLFGTMIGLALATMAGAWYAKGLETSHRECIEGGMLPAGLASFSLFAVAIYGIAAVSNPGVAPKGNPGPEGAGEIAVFAAIYGTLLMMALMTVYVSCRAVASMPSKNTPLSGDTQSRSNESRLLP